MRGELELRADLPDPGEVRRHRAPEGRDAPSDQPGRASLARSGREPRTRRRTARSPRSCTCRGTVTDATNRSPSPAGTSSSPPTRSRPRSCCSSPKSDRMPNGVANSSGQVGTQSHGPPPRRSGVPHARADLPIPGTTDDERHRRLPRRSLPFTARRVSDVDRERRLGSQRTPRDDAAAPPRPSPLRSANSKRRCATESLVSSASAIPPKCCPTRTTGCRCPTRTTTSGYRDPKIEFALHDYNRQAFARAKLVAAQIFAHLGATDIQVVNDDPDTYSGAGHIMGTVRMGSDPATFGRRSRSASRHDHSESVPRRRRRVSHCRYREPDPDPRGAHATRGGHRSTAGSRPAVRPMNDGLRDAAPCRRTAEPILAAQLVDRSVRTRTRPRLLLPLRRVQPEEGTRPSQA